MSLVVALLINITPSFPQTGRIVGRRNQDTRGGGVSSSRGLAFLPHASAAVHPLPYGYSTRRLQWPSK